MAEGTVQEEVVMIFLRDALFISMGLAIIVNLLHWYDTKGKDK